MQTISRTELADLNVFAAVARHRSFRRAAAELGLSTSTLSHAVKALEARLGVRLLNRTSRTVVPTAAGAAFLERLDDGFRQIGEALETLNQFRETPAGRLRINLFRDAARLLFTPIMADYGRAYPDMRLELAFDEAMLDVVAAGYDAGVRYGGSVPEDMIAVRLSPELKWITAAAPSYLAGAAAPRTPDDLASHRCIGLRLGGGGLYRWEFSRDGADLRVEAPAALTVSDLDLGIEAAVAGAGLVYCLEARVADHLGAGRLVAVLPDWAPMGAPIVMYYPSRRHAHAGLRGLIDMARAHAAKTLPG